MKPHIAPVTITRYNTRSQPEPLVFNVTSSREIIQDTSNYQVTVRKMEVPINNKLMPIHTTSDPFKISIFNEYKPTDRVIPGLVYGLNEFIIPGVIVSVRDFIQDINNIVFKKPSPIELGYFDLKDDQNITYQYDEQYGVEHDMIKIYFDKRLQRLFDFDYDHTDKIGDLSRLKIVKNYTTTTHSIKIIDAKSYTFPLFYNLKAVRIYTNLPIDAHKIYDMEANDYSDSSLLHEIVYNSMQMYNNSNLIYIPTNFSYSTMNQVNSLKNFNLSLYYLYADGTEMPVRLDVLEYASVSLAFERVADRVL